jgi:hypothetical protein
MTTSLPSPVEALLEAANNGDSAAFLDTFTTDGVVDDWGREFRGRTAIEGWSQKEFIGVRVTLRPAEVVENGGEWTVTATVGGDGFNGPSHFSFQVEGTLVKRMTIRE